MRAWVMACSVAVSVGLAIGAGCTTLLEGHCANQDGDATCVSSGLGRYCNKCVGAANGCSEELPAEGCYFAGEAGTTGDSGEGGTGSLGVEGTTGSGTAGAEPCVSSEDCTDPEAPFCGVTGVCGTCEMTADPDGECAAVDPMTPLCAEGTCVACTPDNPAVCDEMLLVCDGDTNSCVACTEHAQCASGACELAVGTCFPNDVVVHVDGDGGQDFTSVVEAVSSIGEGMHGVIVVHEIDGGISYQGNVIIEGGKTIALLAAPGEQPSMRGTGGSSSILIAGTMTALYVDGIRLAHNNYGYGMNVGRAFVWVDRSHVVQNIAGGIFTANGASVTIRNSFVGSGDDANAVEINTSTATILSSTIGAGTANSIGLGCSLPEQVVVRNSILVSRGNIGTGGIDILCPEAEVTYSATESMIPGQGNETVGELATAMPTQWFVDYPNGDFHLQNQGLTVFADIGRWQAGDPKTDIDGDPRPLTDASPDYAGADVPLNNSRLR